jgi:hypothetical protein
MRIRRTTLVVVVSWLGVLAAGGPASAQARKEPAAVIVSPEDGDKVTQYEDLQGRLNTRGWPIVLIKPPSGEAWWVQSPVDEVTKGSFITPVQFGIESTPQGTEFRVAIVVVRSKKEAYEKYPAGTRLKSLPPGQPRSETFIVKRK